MKIGSARRDKVVRSGDFQVARLVHRIVRAVKHFEARKTGLDELWNEIVSFRYPRVRERRDAPACPDHTEKETLWKLLDAEAKTGIRLTESYAMWPGSSVSGLYFAHPESRYFAVGKLGRDQVEDYAKRKVVPLTEAERWLGPWLNYDPAS